MLGPINLTFHPGEILFIVGGNGSGKSTLVKLITGLYIPATGRIQLDDCDITDRNREWYRQQFSAVFSDFYLFGCGFGLMCVWFFEIREWLYELSESLSELRERLIELRERLIEPTTTVVEPR